MMNRAFWSRAAPFLMAIAAAGLSFARLAPLVRSTLWAEDGALFIAEALDGVGFGELFAPYGGYLHVVPRALGGLIVELVATRKFAIAANLAACAVTGVIVGVIYVCAEDLVPRALLRVWLGLMTVLVPLAGVEVIANLANLHSFFFWGAFWALLRRPRTTSGAVGLSVFILLSTLSEFQTVVLAPLVLALLWWRRREWRQLLVVGSYALGVALQIHASMSAPRPMQPHLLGVGEAAQLFGLQVLMPLWSTDPAAIRETLTSYGWGVAVLAALPVLFGIAFTLARGQSALRIVTLLAVGVALGLFGIAHTVNYDARRLSPDFVIMTDADVFIRYAFVPSLLLIALVVFAVQAAWQSGDRWASAAGAISLVALLLASFVGFRHEGNRRREDTSWPKEMTLARKHCRAHAGEGTALLQISPHLRWVVELPCWRVLEAGSARAQR